MAKKSQSIHLSPYRIFLVLDPFRDLVPRLPAILGRLADIDPYLPIVEGHYNSTTGSALLCLHFPRRAVLRIGAELVIELVAECGLPVIAPEALPSAEYTALYAHHLPSYDIHVERARDLADSGMLVARVVEVLVEHAARSAASETAPTVSAPAMDLVADAEHDSLEVELDLPMRARHDRASSRWEFDLDLELDPAPNQADHQDLLAPVEAHTEFDLELDPTDADGVPAWPVTQSDHSGPVRSSSQADHSGPVRSSSQSDLGVPIRPSSQPERSGRLRPSSQPERGPARPSSQWELVL